MRTFTLESETRRATLSEAQIRAGVGAGILSLVLATQFIWSLLAH